MKLYHVSQQLVSRPLVDVAEETFQALDGLNIQVPQGPVAITAGSRGINNIATITKACGDWLRSQGAEPFIVPAMGSHNGATAEGQRAMIESLGITEQAMGMPIRATMETVTIGELPTGPITIDRNCHEAAGTLVLNRIKLHTCFSGPPESGIQKMMAIGMGKIDGARSFHAIPTLEKAPALVQMAETILATGKVLCGLGIIEDGFDQTAELHALRPDEIVAREPELLEYYRTTYFPQLPVDQLDVLVVSEIGKTYSGLGMDPNVIGRRGLVGIPDFPTPKIETIVALELIKASQGNALGFGLGDAITQRLYDSIDFEKTRINAETTGDMERIRMVHICKDDKDAFDWCRGRSGEKRWLVIPNTLHLGSIYCSEGLREELAEHPLCQVGREPTEATFEAGRMQLAF